MNPPLAPTVLAGRYSLGELLGRGGMGEVRAGWDDVLDRPVAVKMLRADVGAVASSRRRFRSEARAAAQLHHPNVVAVYDSGESGGIPFIVMEWLPGRSLRDVLASGPMPLEAVETLALQVLAALDAAHRAGLVHRDIKPANVLAAADGSWKVADFGIAKSLQPESPDETVTGLVLGTPAYLPPERLLGGDATPAGDLYALGVIMYEALAGRKPFEATTPEGWAGVAGHPAPGVAAWRAEVPAGLAGAVDRSIDPVPGRRFSSAAEMAATIRAPGGEAADPRPVGWIDIAPAAEAPDARDATEVLPPVRRRRGTAVLVAAIAGLLAFGVAFAAAGGSTSGSGRPPATPSTTTTVAVTTVPPTTVAATVPVVQTGNGRGHGNGNGQGGGGGKD